MKRIVLWLVFIIFNSLGLLLLYTAINHFRTAASSRNWSAVNGEILSAKVRKEENRNTHRERGEPVTFSYFADIKYNYSVDGKNYEGDRLTVEDFGTNDRQRAEDIVMQYRAGQQVTVYYNPSAPLEALLIPGESGGAWGTLIMGLAFLIVPTALVVFVGGRDLFPRTLQLWWDIKFGKYSKLQDSGQFHPSEQPVAAVEQPAAGTLPEKVPAAADFQETIVEWHPGRRVVISIDPPNIWFLVLGSGILGLIAALFGSVIIGMLLFAGIGFRGEHERAGYFAIFAVIFVLVSGYLFLSTRLKHRRSRTIFDWDTQMLDAEREFSVDWQGSLHDIQKLIVRCAPTRGRKRRYRAIVELDVVGKTLVAARTAQVRRKPEKARADALSLAEPLAAALGVPVLLEAWDDVTE